MYLLLKFSVVLTLAIFLSFSAAHAESLKEIVNNFEVIPIKYGVNNLTVNDNNIVITRADFKNESAWGGGVYNILVKDKDKWQLVRFGDKNGLNNETAIQSVPHTGEDQITTIHFLAPKNTAGNIKDIYLLKSSRADYFPSPSDLSIVKFLLYKLVKDDSFGIYYFQQISISESEIKYCSTDSAVYHELNIKLPDYEEHSCRTR